MKKFTLIILSIFCVVSLYGQKKKKHHPNQIKSITVLNENTDNAKTPAIKESYTRYDELGNVLEEIEYDAKGVEKKHIIYEYNDDGEKVKETYLNQNGSKDKIIEFKYEDGLKTEKITYEGNGKIKSKKKYIYEYQ